MEFDFNLALATKIGAALMSKGCASKLIGSRGDIKELAERTAQTGNAKLFLSVHHDSVQSKFLTRWSYNGGYQRYSDQFAGFSLFVSRRNSDLQRSLLCASAIGTALRGAGFKPSFYHAADVTGERRPFADQKNGVHYYDGLAVLRAANQPAVLLEAGVIVNRDDEIQLSKDEIKGSIAQAVATGVLMCVS